MTLKAAKKRRGRLRFAYGLLGLVEVLRDAWPRVADKTGLTESELTQAEVLGERLSHGVALQNSPIEEFKRLAELRDRAFTVFVRAYGQVRHALQYLRRERNDADRYAPSLYGRRRSRKAKASAQAVAQNADAQAAAAERGASTQPAAVLEGTSVQPAAVAPSANASLLVETVPEQHQKSSVDADSLAVPANAIAVAPRVRARRKQRRAKRAASRRRLQRKAAKRRAVAPG